MPDAKSSKGNPASHRMMNDNLKKRRARSWARGEERKRLRHLENEARHQANLEAGFTNRQARRAAMRAAGELPPIGMTREAWNAMHMRMVAGEEDSSVAES